MWLSERRGLIERRGFLAGLGALALTAGCGFRPVYGPQGQGRALRGAIRLEDPVTRNDFQFVTAFEDILGRPTATRYALSYSITTEEIGGGAVQNLGDTRIQVFGTLGFSVTALDSGAEVASGDIRNNTTYSTTSTQLATLTAKEDAELRLMRLLAEALATRLYTEPGLSPT
ncbi:twin-arginine translocation signal domain-containing protein [Pararhodobacter oceanensis]|uniref:twin-arginine translocation signal domain-containing protein n=1 Tax=Pararhodobacter oceanensis TaxID=2172121 RepID=UPI003A92519B